MSRMKDYAIKYSYCYGNITINDGHGLVKTPLPKQSELDRFLAKGSKKPVCEECGGSGIDPNTDEVCPACEGMTRKE